MKIWRKTDEKDTKFSTEIKSLFHHTVPRACSEEGVWNVNSLEVETSVWGSTICHKLDPYLLLYQWAAQAVPWEMGDMASFQ